jgi:hypothetical protein
MKLDHDPEIEQFRGEVRRFIDTHRPVVHTVREAGVRPRNPMTFRPFANGQRSCSRPAITAATGPSSLVRHWASGGQPVAVSNS